MAKAIKDKGVDIHTMTFIKQNMQVEDIHVHAHRRKHASRRYTRYKNITIRRYTYTFSNTF